MLVAIFGMPVVAVSMAMAVVAIVVAMLRGMVDDQVFSPNHPQLKGTGSLGLLRDGKIDLAIDNRSSLMRTFGLDLEANRHRLVAHGGEWS